MALNSNNIKYLGNNAYRLKSLDELKEGEVYAVGRGPNAFKAFRMVGKDKIIGHFPESFRIEGVDVYEAGLTPDGTEIEEDKVDKGTDVHLDEFMDIQLMGVFRPSKDSRLLDIIKKKLAA